MVPGQHHVRMNMYIARSEGGTFNDALLGETIGLRQRYADCFAFSVANGRGQSFIGASPERLLRVREGRLTTEALAGSVRRGASASEDAALGGALLRDEKELREHRLVIASIERRLAPLGIRLEHSGQPALFRLVNVQHLHTPVQAALPAGVRLLDVLANLHPTPAVGGTPREAAVPHIRALEGFPRGLYAGALGRPPADDRSTRPYWQPGHVLVRGSRHCRRLLSRKGVRRDRIEIPGHAGGLQRRRDSVNRWFTLIFVK